MMACALFIILLCNEKNIRQSNISDYASVKSFHMGTVVSAEVYGEDAKIVADNISDIVEDIDVGLLSVREEKSELYKLNESFALENASQTQYVLSSEMEDIIRRAIDICGNSNGALDITLRPVALLWGIDTADKKNFNIPSMEDIQSTLTKCGYQHLILSDDGYIKTDCDGVQIDLGAIGKGYALDKIKSTLDKSRLIGAAVSVGGSIMVYGSKPDGTNWKVGIRNPFGTIDDMVGYISFPPETNVCVSTSGNYEKYVIKDGVRYHHIFDSHTGYPAEAGLSSVTVISSSGSDSDALSTACFALGYDKSLSLLKKYNAEAIFIDNQGNILLTDGMQNNFTSY